MTSEDLIFQPEMISFREEFMDKFPNAFRNVQPGTKGYEAKLRQRREMKRKKLLEQLALLQQKLENMEHNEENEHLLDKTEAAFKEIPGLTEEYFTRKRAAIEESRP